MSSIAVFVGLDYHQDSVQVCVVDNEGRTLFNRSVANALAEIERAATRHGQPQRMTIAACSSATQPGEGFKGCRGHFAKLGEKRNALCSQLILCVVKPSVSVTDGQSRSAGRFLDR